MSLAGLLTVVVDDPQLQVAVARAAAADGAVTTLAGEDLVAPPTLRPVLAAALARGAHGSAARFVLAVTATAR
jgi:transcription-repair coupling factor (superfamily II helicase)